jgi:hypothetical protein
LKKKNRPLLALEQQPTTISCFFILRFLVVVIWHLLFSVFAAICYCFSSGALYMQTSFLSSSIKKRNLEEKEEEE